MTEEDFYTQLPEDPKNSGIKLKHRIIIDEYFNNGFNGAKAVRKLNKSNKGNESQLFKQITEIPSVSEYIKTKERENERRYNIKGANIVKELINIAYSDATDFLCLKPEEVKLLPPEIRRQIVSFDHKINTYIDRNDIQHKEEIIRFKFADKIKALDMLSKYVGLFSEDNKQRRNNINIDNLDSLTLNNILQVLKAKED